MDNPEKLTTQGTSDEENIRQYVLDTTIITIHKQTQMNYYLSNKFMEILNLET